jgi:hypothetical protein
MCGGADYVKRNCHQKLFKAVSKYGQEWFLFMEKCENMNKMNGTVLKCHF